MTKRAADRHDPNASVARVIRETVKADDPVPADAEAAWRDWSSRLQRVDERTMTLLRTAFEMGVKAGRRERN